ncbi:MAG: copper chaperone PCu(A)C [Alkalimonas sp.]|nr:copper chaperone PCu(A)C [Alkalimonas sp.]
MNTFRLITFSLLFTLLGLQTPAMAVFPATISAEDVMVRVPMPGRTVTAGYLTLKNPTDQPQQLTAVASDAFERVELHTHTHVDGMMRMHEVDQIEIPAHGEVALQPGGLHLMLFNPLIELVADQSLDLTLHFADGHSMLVQAQLSMPPRR